jgi:hypothetical protein
MNGAEPTTLSLADFFPNFTAERESGLSRRARNAATGFERLEHEPPELGC